MEKRKDYPDTIFSPTIERISVKMKNRRAKLTGSLKKRMPISTVPTASMPVYTAYVVPSGSTLMKEEN